MKKNQFGKLLAFLEQLEKAKIRYNLEHCREDAMMVTVVVPGEYWEIEFMDDGEVEVERYRSNGYIYDEKVLGQLFAWHSAESPEASAEEIRQDLEEFYHHVALPENPTSVCNGPPGKR